MFVALGRFAYRGRWPIIAVWAGLLIVCLPLLPLVSGVLKVGGFSNEAAQSARARAVLEERLGFSPVSLVVVFQSADLSATDPAFGAHMRQALEPLRALPNVRDIVYPDRNPRQIGRDGRTAYALVTLDLEPEDSQRLMPAIRRLMEPTPLTTYLAGAPAFYADVEAVSARDLQRAELVALPFAAVALLLVFRSLVGAAVPLAVGGASVAVVLALLYLVGQRTDLSVFVLNLSTMLGLGLAIDYSLFLTSRFREELHQHDVATALTRTVSTAGRAVAFSGLTVLIGLAGLLTFDIMFLRSVGVAGVIVVTMAVLGALTLLPAVLAVLGPHIDAFRLLPEPPDRGDVWEKLAAWIMRRPWMVFIPTLLLLLALGLPFLHVRLSSPDAAILPRDLESRQGYDILYEQYGAGQIAPVLVVVQATDGAILSPAHVSTLFDYTRRIQAVPGVTRVDSITTLDRRLTREQYQILYGNTGSLPEALSEGFLRAYARGDTTLVSVTTVYPPNAPEARALVATLRATPVGPGLITLVDGGPAEIVDIVDGLYSDAPGALLVIVGATYLALLVLFRSVVLPLKAIVMNTLSILASYGALVWIFQDGNLSGTLGFTPLGFVEASLPILMFCTLFGLSMDYEVFLLSRVKEAYDKTGDNAASVAIGLQKSGRIITSAALIVVVVSASFVTADIILVKALGLGIAIAVFLDTTVVRALLVPSTMQLLGHVNWYAPGWLRRLLPNVGDES
ncbi:MAG: MMPL family transporter [Chloroflexi bacterium]|nr:MMPL family transporter [Chloroflexota bacterium]